MNGKVTVLGKYLWLVIFLAVGFAVCQCAGRCGRGADGDTVTVVKIDTVVVVKKDTVPVVKRELVVRYVKVPCETENAYSDSISDIKQDSVCLKVVQKVYEDSVYTAYVSGPKYDEWPKLDSVTVRQLEVIRTVKETVTIREKQSRWSVGVHAGYGVGLQSRSLEPYIGVGVGYALFPP